MTFDVQSLALFVAQVILALLTAAFLLRWEFQRSDRRRLGLRCVLTFIAILSLFLLAIEPQRQILKLDRQQVLLTSGIEQSRLPELAAMSDHGAKFMAVGEIDADHWPTKNTEIQIYPDSETLLRGLQKSAGLRVIGHGLWDYQLDGDDWPAIEFSPSSLSQGISQIWWRRRIALGSELVVRGILAGFGQWPLTIELEDPGGSISAIEVADAKKPAFELRAVPKETGKYLYRIRIKTPSDLTLSSEQLAFEVYTGPHLRILIMQASPRFETNFLKKWAASGGHKLVVRSGMSRDRFLYQSINQNKTTVDRIDDETLHSYDLLLIDSETIAGLQQHEKEAILREVGDEGLGILWFPDRSLLMQRQSSGPIADFSFFRLQSFADLSEVIIRPQLSSAGTEVLSEIIIEPLEIIPDSGLLPFATDTAGRLIAAARQIGIGRVGFSVIDRTYPWLLAGDPHSYQTYWSHLLTNLARRNPDDFRWSHQIHAPLLVDHPVSLFLHSGENNPGASIVDPAGEKSEIHLGTYDRSTGIWNAVFWPKRVGWHEIFAGPGRPFWFFVYPQDSWKTWQQEAKKTATQKKTNRNPIGDQASSSSESIAEPVHAFWFYLLFLIAICGLWVERKMP